MFAGKPVPISLLTSISKTVVMCLTDPISDPCLPPDKHMLTPILTKQLIIPPLDDVGWRHRLEILPRENFYDI